VLARVAAIPGFGFEIELDRICVAVSDVFNQRRLGEVFDLLRRFTDRLSEFRMLADPMLNVLAGARSPGCLREQFRGVGIDAAACL